MRLRATSGDGLSLQSILRGLLALTALWLAGGGVLAGGVPAERERSMTEGDWELRCDNTLTCRAAAYADDDPHEPLRLSLRLTREAGRGTPVQLHLRALWAGDPPAPPSPWWIVFAGQRLPIVPGTPAEVPPADVPAALAQLVQGRPIGVESGGRVLAVSTRGMEPVLAAMDRIQGRVGTTGALLRQGPQDESQVPGPAGMPWVRAVRPPPTLPSDRSAARAIYRELDPEAWEVCARPVTLRRLRVFRLDSQRLLLEGECHNGAYNRADLLWTASRRPPHRPSLLEINGTYDPVSARVELRHKGRGPGDCVHYEAWQFDGAGFARVEARGDHACRGFPGGAWGLPIFRARVLPAAGADAPRTISTTSVTRAS